ncbi:hypothetical protein [Roseomonas chloroacetimidivorans]|uniref:hypothetical protein n=1 Tax=Roseomonas chloroacetimidivorans TaxID=1766656 RepID=UPI003C74F35D
MIDIAKLRKVHAMTSSPNPHEAAVAWSKVDGILKAGGKTRADLPGLLGAYKMRPPFPPFMHDFHPNRVMAKAVADCLRAARDVQRRREPQHHPDGRIGFLYVNRHHLKEGELRELLGIAASHRRLTRRQSATADYLVQRVQARRNGKETARA